MGKRGSKFFKWTWCLNLLYTCRIYEQILNNTVILVPLCNPVVSLDG
jgi:hypothetical protein